MKLFLIKGITFILMLLTVLIVFNHQVRVHTEPNDFYKLSYDDLFNGNDNHADIIIIGTSHAKHGINPKYIGYGKYNIYNFALNGSDPKFISKWYHKIYRLYRGKPRIIIFDVSSFLLTNRLARHYEQDSIYFPLKIFWKELLDPANNGMMLLMNRFPIFREKGNFVKIFRLRKKNLNENRMFDVSNYYNGFIPFNSAQPVKPEKYEYGVISGENLETFKKLLAEFSRDKIMVIFVRTPEYVPFIDESQFDAADKYLTIEANRHGFYYYNYSRERKSYINYGREYFSTVGHLNEAGSALFSKMLYADLKDLLATK